jgi:hypothetical protein
MRSCGPFAIPLSRAAGSWYKSQMLDKLLNDEEGAQALVASLWLFCALSACCHLLLLLAAGLW